MKSRIPSFFSAACLVFACIWRYFPRGSSLFVGRRLCQLLLALSPPPTLSSLTLQPQPSLIAELKYPGLAYIYSGMAYLAERRFVLVLLLSQMFHSSRAAVQFRCDAMRFGEGRGQAGLGAELLAKRVCCCLDLSHASFC